MGGVTWGLIIALECSIAGQHSPVRKSITSSFAAELTVSIDRQALPPLSIDLQGTVKAICMHSNSSEYKDLDCPL